MLQWVFERARQAKNISDVVVATDSREIEAAALDFGANVFRCQRPHTCGSDRAAEVARTLDAEIVVNVQGDQPFVRANDIELIVSELRTGSSKLVSAMVPLEHAEDLNDPDVVKVAVDRHGDALRFSRSPIPVGDDVATSQPEGVRVRKHLGLYGFLRTALLEFASLETRAGEVREGLEQLRAVEAGWRIRMLEVTSTFGSVDNASDLARARGHLLSGGALEE